MTKPKTTGSPAEMKSDHGGGEGVVDHKLCGYLSAVLQVSPPRKTLPTSGRCYVSRNSRGDLQFFCDGAELLPIPSTRTEGSLSVVRQIQTLLINRCLNFVARVIGVSARDDEVRALVLVDVYLPNRLWSAEWQFPKSRSVATAFFKHLSCDWKNRQSILSGDLWNIPECHAIGCKHRCSFDTNGELFQLHEIFKTLPSVTRDGLNLQTFIGCSSPDETGLWLISDDLVLRIISLLEPADLVRVSAACRHLRSLAACIIPRGKLKLFPHQQAAVGWMLARERVPRALHNSSDVPFIAEDGSRFYINMVSGKIGLGSVPEVMDFRGGLFCDEPGLGKTITALSLILKTKGALPDPPGGVQVIRCSHRTATPGYRCCYYDDVWTQNLGLDGRLSANEEAENVVAAEKAKTMRLIVKRKRSIFDYSDDPSLKRKRPRVVEEEHPQTWVQCDGCDKWRRLLHGSMADTSRAWFCSMNEDPFHQYCTLPEETAGKYEAITHLPGFCARESEGGLDENVSYFISVLKKHKKVLEHRQTEKVLKWLLKLAPIKLAEIETKGLVDFPVSLSQTSDTDELHHGLFRAFGLVKRVVRGVTRWFYPKKISNDLVFDFPALRMARKKSLDSSRFFLSQATLIVVPANLVEHWETQIRKHAYGHQLRVYVWSGTHRTSPAPHDLAWNYDVVITTFSRLSVEWGHRQESALMQVHWLRVMLDEGHTLGSSLHSTSKLQTAVYLRASRRWVLTGTPTPNTPTSQLSHLHPMLKFLHEKSYGLNQKAWKDEVVKPFEAENEEGRSRLLQLLQRCMISARKADLKPLPPCIKRVTLLEFTEEHARTYNELVETVRRNILLADWNDPSHVESLLNPKQWKFRSNLIRNIRLSCCVSGNIRVTDAGKDLQETMDTLLKSGLDQNSQEYQIIWFNLLHGGSCARCKVWCRLPIITPCRHFLCLDCTSSDSTMCPLPGCGRLYEMQNPDTRVTRPENPDPKWPVPKDLIELQPSYKQDDWHSEWQLTSSSKVSYLVDRLQKIQEGSKDTEKVIVFSQFLEHIQVIQEQLSTAGIKYAGMFNPMSTSGKMMELCRYQHDETCMVLVMDGSAALGLDLSFVSHVFLMEPIWDKSVEDQVISRAHRMGATRAVNVETLAMSGTIEEQMLKFLEEGGSGGDRLLLNKDESGKNSGRVHRTLHDFADTNYLSRLRFVRTG